MVISPGFIAFTGICAALHLTDAIFHADGAVSLEARQLPKESMPFEPIATVSDWNCLAAIVEVDKTFPTPPPQLAEHMDHDYCITDLPKNLSAQASSFANQWSSWTSEHLDEIKSAWKECPSMTKEIDRVINMCLETGAFGEPSIAPRQMPLLLAAVLGTIGAFGSLI
ncbi:hypothetical protein NLU13_5067 [Sarocladium strictum]|uniref:Uncharacterized protein n=1 Tax=Sarocladium strictum TaxID=5046 RepID=A0AA39GLU6_SARSR|nr:hypothetical protein NLU13_5067 [Sarocladium strictum]